MKSKFKTLIHPNDKPETASAKPEEPEESRMPLDDRREFLKKTAIGGLSLGGAFMFSPIEDTLAYTTQKVRRYSSPSDLKITDMRIADFDLCPILKIYTNQGITGLGDVRDGADKRYALMLKSRILGENPCNVEKIFKIIKQFGGQSRQAGGVCGVEMALWDIVGKAFGVPVYQLMGGKYRDKVRAYCDTSAPRESTPQNYATKMKGRAAMGFTWFKMDMGLQIIENIPGALVNAKFWEKDGRLRQWDSEFGSYGMTKHPFNRVQLTQKGIDGMVKVVAAVRDAIGYDHPLSTDHWGHFGVKEAIKLARAMEPYDLAWMEDLIPWEYTDQYKMLKDSTTTPILTGEDIYLLDGFKPLIDNRAVDMIHPDINSSGGILETKKIGDYAEEHGIAMAMHHAASPVSYMASVHVAASTQNFEALEYNGLYNSWWDDTVKGDIHKPIVDKGFITVPDAPGLGVELNDDVIKQHLIKGGGFFEPTPEWDHRHSGDRLWS
jgi:L-alanine-DL-glutamate epimerase-like enolase superfamily enzyme